MPIKFRCNYCHQFLGISRAQAGGLVDCPTCGQSIRVPVAEGTVAPVEAPVLDQEDAHLARALDELARLVDLPAEQVVPVRSASADPLDDGSAEHQIPQPLPEPIPIEVPLPPTPVVIAPPVNASLSPGSAVDVASERGLLEELAVLSAQAGASTGQPDLSSDEHRTLPLTSRPNAAPLRSVLICAALFVAGMLTERFVRILEVGWPTSQGVVTSQTDPLPVSELTGRILYKTAEGGSQPDRGARLILFPAERVGTVKLSSVGFRPADSPADQGVADAAIKALGGTAATTDERGEFRVEVEAGAYQLLILSHFQPRSEGEVNPTLEKLLQEYFDRPAEVLGRVQFQFSPIRIKGAGDQWDHSF